MAPPTKPTPETATDPIEAPLDADALNRRRSRRRRRRRGRHRKGTPEALQAAAADPEPGKASPERVRSVAPPPEPATRAAATPSPATAPPALAPNRRPPSGIIGAPEEGDLVIFHRRTAGPSRFVLRESFD